MVSTQKRKRICAPTQNDLAPYAGKEATIRWRNTRCDWYRYKILEVENNFVRLQKLEIPDIPIGPLVGCPVWAPLNEIRTVHIEEKEEGNAIEEINI
jgi:hypothetical protein